MACQLLPPTSLGVCTLCEDQIMATKTKRRSSKRELINTGRDKRYVRRDAQGQFKEVDEQSRSLSQDRRRKAKTTVKAGQGDRGDRKRR